MFRVYFDSLFGVKKIKNRFSWCTTKKLKEGISKNGKKIDLAQDLSKCQNGNKKVFFKFFYSKFSTLYFYKYTDW